MFAACAASHAPWIANQNPFSIDINMLHHPPAPHLFCLCVPAAAGRAEHSDLFGDRGIFALDSGLEEHRVSENEDRARADCHANGISITTT
jgi:hypothetical protein